MNGVRFAAACGLIAACIFSAPAFSDGISGAETVRQEWKSMEASGQMDLAFATQFQVDYYPDGYALITVAGEEEYLLVPEGKIVPEDLEENIVVLRQPLDHIYLGSSSAMDLFLRAGALDHIAMTSTSASNWSIPEIRDAVEREEILYAGKYSAPDYEAILEEGCSLALENTMIFHCPEVKEQLERLGIPVIVERSSYETHPLGRVEWIRLYGLLAGKTEEAEAFFRAGKEQVDALGEQELTGKTVVFFYITSSGYANVRKPGDYIAKMIHLAGGSYLFSELEGETENALSTMNMEMETFYAMARDADILIYNSTVGAELDTIEELTSKNPLLSGFKAVRNGEVWCTNQNMFQQVSGTAEMIADFHKIFTGDDSPLTFLHRLI